MNTGYAPHRGVLILVFKPFKIGDVVDAAGVKGKVVDIGIFTTTMNTPDNKKMAFVNAQNLGYEIHTIPQDVASYGITVDAVNDAGFSLSQVDGLVVHPIGGLPGFVPATVAEFLYSV